MFVIFFQKCYPLMCCGGNQCVPSLSQDEKDKLDANPLAEGRWDHSQTGLTTCGGEDRGPEADVLPIPGEKIINSNKWTCLSIANGSWHLSHHLITPRWRHTAWSSREGVLLIGGSSTTSYGTNAPLTADKLTDGKSEIYKYMDFQQGSTFTLR